MTIDEWLDKTEKEIRDNLIEIEKDIKKCIELSKKEIKENENN
jgi:hypothetical protein